MSRCRPAAFLLVLFSFAVHQAFAASTADYAGQYVLRLGPKNYLVLNLRDEQGRLTGALSRPHHASLGTFFSNISSDVITDPIVSASPQQNHLHIVVRNPANASDTDAYDLTLLSPEHASLQPSFPIDPWTLTRVPASPVLSVATDWSPQCSYYPDDFGQSNPEMQRIIDDDQKARQPTAASHDIVDLDWAVISKQDEARRKQVLELLTSGALHTGKDFEHAAFVFQHGTGPDDYLLAHTLAMIAVARGDAGALWIGTATLDRYLNSIKQPQIYGTQYHHDKNQPWTQEPYNRTLISDALRKALSVPGREAQQKQLEMYKAANK